MDRDEYLDRLILALRAYQMSGQEVADIIGELKTHLDDTGADPEDEFGSVFDLADMLAERTVERPYMGQFLVFSFVFLVATLSAVMVYFGLTGRETVIALDVAVAVVVWAIGLLVVGRILIEDAVTMGRDPNYTPGVAIRRATAVLLASFATAAAAGILLPKTELFDPPLWLSGLVVVASATWLIFELGRQRRFGRMDRTTAPEPAKNLIERWTGDRGIATGIKLARSEKPERR